LNLSPYLRRRNLGLRLRGCGGANLLNLRLSQRLLLQ
jgi:hypothetical protein